MHFSYYHIAEIFGLSEVLLLLAKRSKKGTAKSQADSKSLILLWVTIAAGMVAGGTIATNGVWPLPNTRLILDLGIALAIMGFAIRWTAILQLGKMFTVDVAIVSSHTLKTTGLYKVVRHPSYLGLMLIICSIALCQCDVLSLIVTIIPTFLALNYRIKVEEKTLLAEFGEQYEQYKKNTARIIPGVY